MLLEYGAQNFFSFNEGFEASFRLNNKCPQEISKGQEFSNVMCVRGGNGSGKTNVLKALSFLRYFCVDSFSLKPDEKIYVEPFFKNDKSSDFFVVFNLNGIEYRYELEVTSQEVISEVLYRKKNRYVKIVERKFNKIIYTSSQYTDLKLIKLRRNASLISTANQYEIVSMKEIYTFFKTIISNVDHWGRIEPYLSINTVSELYLKDESMLEFVVDTITKCDLGINNIKILKKENVDGNDEYFPVFYHELDKEMKTLALHHESSGTVLLYKILSLYKYALDRGGVLILDEFDINLHPHILPLLIEFFDNSEKNVKNAQLLFTTHNSEIMDFLGKYRTMLVNKEHNSSYAYRLDEIPGNMIRNDRAISPIYNLGKIGGVPRI